MKPAIFLLALLTNVVYGTVYGHLEPENPSYLYDSNLLVSPDAGETILEAGHGDGYFQPIEDDHSYPVSRMYMNEPLRVYGRPQSVIMFEKRVPVHHTSTPQYSNIGGHRYRKQPVIKYERRTPVQYVKTPQYSNIGGTRYRQYPVQPKIIEKRIPVEYVNVPQFSNLGGYRYSQPSYTSDDGATSRRILVPSFLGHIDDHSYGRKPSYYIPSENRHHDLAPNYGYIGGHSYEYHPSLYTHEEAAEVQPSIKSDSHYFYQSQKPSFLYL